MTRTPARTAAVPLAALALLLSGCAGDPSPERAASTTTAPTPTQTASPTPTPSPPPPPTAMTPAGDPVALASGLGAPWSIAFVGDTALLSERDTGTILELGPATGGSTRVVGTVPDVCLLYTSPSPRDRG